MEPGGTWTLRLSVRRKDMAPATGGLTEDHRYRSLINVTTDGGMAFQLPVSSDGLASPSQSGVANLSAAPSRMALLTAADPNRTGLWVGTAVIDLVSEPADATDRNALKPTDSEASFRIMLHVDQLGAVRLLRQVLILWKDGETDSEGNLIIPGRYVLITDDSLASQYKGSTIRSGKQVGRRISTVAFAFDEPQAMSGAFAGTLDASTRLDYDDPLNPFKHKYHPDHDNLDTRFEQKLPEGIESFTIVRDISLAFAADDPEDLAAPGWGDTRFGGTYRETITGVHRHPIHIGGHFALTRVSDIGLLNE